MATLEEVLNSIPDIDYLHDRIQFSIDEDLRLIAVPTSGNVIGVVGDKNTNRVNFKMVRYYNGFDMSTFEVRVNYKNVNGDTNYYPVVDVTIEDDYILFTWLVESDMCVEEGTGTFSVRMLKTTEDGTVLQEFNTTTATGKILPTIDAYDKGIESNVDLLNRLKYDVYISVMNSIEANNSDTVSIISKIGSGSSRTSVMDMKIQTCVEVTE